MVNCIVFRKAIQKVVKEGRFKLVEKEMTVITYHFPAAKINMVSFSRESMSDSPSKRWKQSIRCQWRQKRVFEEPIGAGKTLVVSSQSRSIDQKTSVFDRLTVPKSHKPYTPTHDFLERRANGSEGKKGLAINDKKPDVFDRLEMPR